MVAVVPSPVVIPDPSELVVKILNKERDGEGLVELRQAYVRTTSIGEITVPVGYVTDCASVPRLMRWILPQLGHCAFAAVIHDWLLHNDDKRATKVFSEILKEDGAGTIRRYLMVAFVWVFTFPRIYM